MGTNTQRIIMRNILPKMRNILLSIMRGTLNTLLHNINTTDTLNVTHKL